MEWGKGHLEGVLTQPESLGDRVINLEPGMIQPMRRPSWLRFSWGTKSKQQSRMGFPKKTPRDPAGKQTTPTFQKCKSPRKKHATCYLDVNGTEVRINGDRINGFVTHVIPQLPARNSWIFFGLSQVGLTLGLHRRTFELSASKFGDQKKSSEKCHGWSTYPPLTSL